MGLSSEDVIKQKLKDFERDGVFIAPFTEKNYSEKKLINACKTYGNNVDPMTVVGFVDTTILGSGKEGILFTGKEVFYKVAFGDVGSVKFDEVEKAEYIEQEITDSKGKVKKDTKVNVTYKNGEDKTINQIDEYNNKLFADVLIGISEEAEVIDSTEQLVTLNDLGDEVITIYLKMIMNYLKEDDGIIDSTEYKELIGLMTRLNIKQEVANQLRVYRLETGISEPSDDLIKQFVSKIPNGSKEIICQSMVNDLLVIRKEIIDDWKGNKDFIRYKELLDVSDEQVEFFIRKLKQDQAIIAEKIDDNTIKKTANELIAVGGAAGVSLAALTVTGGVSTGVWGGLLTLGMASTGGMIIGLAAIAGAGYASYKGIKYLSGTSEIEKYGIRMSMLQEKIKQLQLSQNFLLEDINWTSTQIAELIKDKETIMANFEKIQILVKTSKNLQKSSEEVTSDEKVNTREVLLSQLPDVLDESRCNELLSRTRYEKTFKEFIYNYYEKKEEVYNLKEEIATDILEKLVGVFSQIGYYDTAKSLAAQGSLLKKKGVETIKGLLN